VTNDGGLNAGGNAEEGPIETAADDGQREANEVPQRIMLTALEGPLEIW
jgi:hypothetical protein